MFQFPGLAFVPYGFRNKYLTVELCKSEDARPEPEITGTEAPKTDACAAPSSELQSSKVGFPIRKFSDQSLFAAPRNLSQRTTSFIASQRQGIHRIPLRHLIALIIDAHRSAAAVSRVKGDVIAPIERPVLLQTHPGTPRSSRAHRLVMPIVRILKVKARQGTRKFIACPERPVGVRRKPDAFPLHDV